MYICMFVYLYMYIYNLPAPNSYHPVFQRWLAEFFTLRWAFHEPHGFQSFLFSQKTHQIIQINVSAKWKILKNHSQSVKKTNETSSDHMTDNPVLLSSLALFDCYYNMAKKGICSNEAGENEEKPYIQILRWGLYSWPFVRTKDLSYIFVVLNLKSIP